MYLATLDCATSNKGSAIGTSPTSALGPNADMSDALEHVARLGSFGSVAIIGPMGAPLCALRTRLASISHRGEGQYGPEYLKDDCTSDRDGQQCLPQIGKVLSPDKGHAERDPSLGNESETKPPPVENGDVS